MSDGLINSDSPFSAVERDTAQVIAGLMIPASDEYEVPGADDAHITAAIIDHLATNSTLVSDGLQALDDAATAAHQRPFPELADDDKMDVVQGMLSRHGVFLQTLMVRVVQCYYEDTRVMTSLDMELRPPFPDGFEVEQGDWSLLDPVRRRHPFYRKVS